MTDSNVDIDPGFWTRTSLLQLGYAVWVNLSVIQIGMVFAFSAVIIPQLDADDSFIKTTLTDNSWIVSCIFLSSPVGCVVCGWLMDSIGRRLVLVISQVPLFIGWLYMGLALTPKDLIIGRTITGFGSGMVISAPRVYMTEIALPNMRGLVGAFPNIAMSLGIFAQAELGFFVNWYIICYICAFYTATLMIANTFLPETPYYLLMKSTAESARSTLKRFRSRNFDINTELDEMQEFKEANHIRKLSIREHINALFRRSSCIPFAIVNVYIFFMQLSGVTILILWAIEMIKDSKSSVDPYFGNIILSIVRVLSAIVAAFLFFKFGRRSLALISSTGVAAMALSIGIFIHVAEEPSMFPLICYVGYISFATVGYYSLPFVIMFELYPLQVRGLLGGISISFFYLILFSTNLTHPFIRIAMGHANTMIVFGIFSILCTIFLYFCLPETKHLTLSEIEEYYNARRPTLVSRRVTSQARESTDDSGDQWFKRPLEITKSKENLKVASAYQNIKSRSSTGMIYRGKDVKESVSDDKNDEVEKNTNGNKKRKDDEAGPSSQM